MKKRLLDFQKDVKSQKCGKGVVFCAAQLNPITRSDAYLMEHIIQKAKSDKMDVFVFTERKQNCEALPLKFDKRVKLIEQAYPEIYVNKNRKIRTVVEALAHLEENQYKSIHVITDDKSRNNLSELLEDTNMAHTIEIFQTDESERDTIKEAIYSRDVSLLKENLPPRLREVTTKIMSELISGYKVHLVESERINTIDDSYCEGDVVQANIRKRLKRVSA